jgi:large subunit ribosomal protein L3
MKPFTLVVLIAALLLSACAAPAAVDVPSDQSGYTITGVAVVDVTGTSKGKGFAGVMKRHGFSGQPQTHGTERKHRSPGSISAHATNRGWGGDIKRGKRMAGHMGAAHVTTRNCRLVRIDPQNNLLLVQGPVPGANGGFVFVRVSKKKVRANP